MWKLYSIYLMLMPCLVCNIASGSRDQQHNPHSQSKFGEDSHPADGFLSDHKDELTTDVPRTMATFTDSHQTVTPGDIVSSCEAFIDAFGDGLANFSKCMISYARPLRFCEKCVTSYTAASTQYHVLMEGTTPDDHGSQCGTMILNSDRIQLIVLGAQFMDDMWNKCNCQNCFEYYQDNNGTVESHLNNRTSSFLEMVQDVHECFFNHSERDVTPYTTNITNSTVCKDCKHIYKKLNVLYEEVQHHYHNEACMDVVDAMNYTRSLWSREYQCSQQKGDVLPVIIVSSLFALMPIVFYIGNMIHGTRSQNKIVKQKRLRDVAASMTESTS